MNNNYHTQLNKYDQNNKNNILNEVAYENNLGPNYQGTPINKSNQYNPQIMYTASQPKISNPSNITTSSKIVDEEIELSETRNDSSIVGEQMQINQQLQEVIQNNTQIPQQKSQQNSDHYIDQNQLRKHDNQDYSNNYQHKTHNFKNQRISFEGHDGSDSINHKDTFGSQYDPNIQSIPQKWSGSSYNGSGQYTEPLITYSDTKMQGNNYVPKNNNFNIPNKKILLPEMQINPNLTTPSKPFPIYLENPKPKNGVFANYVIIPLLIAILFVFLVYPKTCTFIEKIVPPMSNFKGYLIRGVILGLVYIVIKFIVDCTNN